MADYTYTDVLEDGTKVVRRAKDMGDGTFADVVSAVTSGAAGFTPPSGGGNVAGASSSTIGASAVYGWDGANQVWRPIFTDAVNGLKTYLAHVAGQAYYGGVSIAASITSINLLGSNQNNRNMFMITNASTANLYIFFGTTASTSLYTAKIVPGGYFECPLPAYGGRVDGIWDAAVGAAMITEY